MVPPVTFDPKELESKVKAMYRSVAENPHGEFHFEMGRAMAERLGYAPADLDRIPKEAIESFAGVGYYFHLADLKEGETVLDLGSGSGMDTFIAALKVGPGGKVIGVDMTDEQRTKAERLRDRDGFKNVTYLKGYIENVPAPAASFDAVISNGVIIGNRQGQSLPRGRTTAQSRRPACDFRHRHRGSTARDHRVQFDAMGCLHRRRRPAGQLSQADRSCRPENGKDPGQSGLPVHLGQRAWRQ